MREKLGHLGKGVAIYGAGDAAVNVVNFLLLAVYVKFGYLDTNDYGAIALITAFEGIAKIVSRLGPGRRVHAASTTTAPLAVRWNE